MDLHGGNLIGGSVSKAGSRQFRGIDPTTGQELDPAFVEATDDEVDQALTAAAAALPAYRRRSREDVARFLEAIEAEILLLDDALVARAQTETALTQTRLTNERDRTCAQLRMFADLVRDGSWVDARIDHAQPDRKPLPRPDLRRMLVPIGPVAVFASASFPLAFSVAGADTASALAAGNPVVVKSHPGHPGTSELAAHAIASAARACDMPAGIFSMVHGHGGGVGLTLVRHRETRAVAFTGSFQGGRALFDAAAARPVPIPVFACMRSVNPVFLLPGALRERGAEIAQAYVASLGLGVGQSCTSSGLAVGLAGPELDRFLNEAAWCVAQQGSGAMLHERIAERYRATTATWSHMQGVQVVGRSDVEGTGARVPAVVFATDGRAFLDDARLRQGIFGPSTLVVGCESREQLYDVARRLEGQLAIALHATLEDVGDHAALLELLQERAGRLILNGFPNDIEVASAMQHGGPYPATTDARFTSAGPAAILRFARPICFQDFPQEHLPAELQDENPRKIRRQVDGEWSSPEAEAPTS